jgi:GT2 family glycosyltransferase
MDCGISIVIPTWNGLDLLKRFLPSVIAAARCYLEQSGAPVEIIIVDDGSEDQTTEWLLDHGFRLGAEFGEPCLVPSLSRRLIKNESNLGFGPSCNLGFAAARYPLVLLLNNDVEVSRELLALLAENFKDDSVFAVHCRVFDLESGAECGTGKLGSYERGFIRVHRSYRPVCASGEPLYSMFAGGGSAMFDRKKFLAIGGFDPLLAPFYWEDVELSYRAWKRGYIVLYEPRATVRHRISSTIGKMDRRRVRLIQQRNRLLYHWIHLHDKWFLFWHVVWVIFLTALVRPSFLLPLFAAVKKLPIVMRRRSQEKHAARRSDREVFSIFRSLARRTDLNHRCAP